MEKMKDDVIYRQMAIDALAEHEKSRGHNYTLFVDIVSECAEIIRNLPPVQQDNRLEKIADIVEGTIDHLDRDDAMDLLYQIKEIVGNETSNI